MSGKEYVSEEEKRRKHLFGWSALLLLLFLLVIIVNLRITEIRVYGNRNYTAEEATEMILPDGWDRNPLIAFVKNRFLPHKSYPFVASYDVRITGPQKAEITLYEKTPLGCVSYMSSCMFFDKDGIVIESSPERIEDIPEITGLKFGKIVIGKKLEVNDADCYETIMNITQQLSTFGISCSRIDFDSLKNVTLYIDGGNIRVKLGNDTFLTAKLGVLGDVIGEMRSRNMSGTADLSGYQDRTSDGFTFIPDETAKTEE